MTTNDYKNLFRPYSRMLWAALWCVGVPGTSAAVTVGNAEVRSHLEQPLVVEIPLTNISTKELQQLAVKVAPELAFREFGYDYSPVLRNLRFNIEPLTRSSAVLRINTTNPINEPFLAVMLEFRTGKSGFIRGYTLLLDPIEYPLQIADKRPAPPAQREPRPVPKALTSKSTAADAATPPPQSTPPQTMERYGPVRAGETLSHIANRLGGRFNVGMSRMTWGLFLTNPSAFLDNNAHALKAGAYLDMPTAQTLARISTLEATAGLAAQQTARFGGTSPRSEAASVVEADVATSPTSDSGATTQVRAPELGFDLSPRLKIRSDVADPMAAIPTDTRLSQLLDPTAKVAVATDTAGADQHPVRSPEKATAKDVSDLVQSGVITPPSDSQALSADVERLEALVKNLQDQLDRREQQVTSLEQKLEAVTTSVERTPKPPSAFTNLLTPINLLSGAFALAGIALLAWVFVRRKDAGDSKRDRGETSALYERAVTPPSTVDDDEPSFASPIESQSPTFAKLQNDVDETSELREALGLGTEFLTGDLRDSELAMKVSETDVLEELELYINGGYYNDAKKLLMRLVDNEPDNTDFRLQLLRVLRILGEGDEFIRQAKLARTVIEDPDGTIWEDIRRMGAEIRPSEPLFADDYFAITEEEDSEPEPPARDHVVEFKP